MNLTAHIGLFDSGMGGLTVLKALHDTYPYLRYTYYADIANAPYGDKTKDTLFAINTTLCSLKLTFAIYSVYIAHFI